MDQRQADKEPKPRDRREATTDRGDSARREDPVAKELRFDRVTKEANKKNARTEPKEAKEDARKETNRSGGGNEQCKSQSESEPTLEEEKPPRKRVP